MAVAVAVVVAAAAAAVVAPAAFDPDSYVEAAGPVFAARLGLQDLLVAAASFSASAGLSRLLQTWTNYARRSV